MAKVTPLFKTDSVQNCLWEAADLGLTELILIGKKQGDAGFYLRISPCKNAYELVGMAEALKHELMTALQEEAV